ncbi:MAG: amidohydrolase [Phycisphaera sp.]|nr:amidohydrolase [Phycisphaera sp.]
MDIPSDILRRATEIRRDLHAHPEIAYEEHRTSDVIAAELRDIGIEHATGLAGGTGVLGWIPGTGDEEAIGLRADIDALPITEETGADWASTIPGRMHACGHDGHTAILLGTARNLARIAATDGLARPVVLLFQPAEEGGGGGARMVEDGVLDARVAPHPVERIYGLHGWPEAPAGTAGTRPGPLLAASDRFEIDLEGEGCHAAWPQTGRDTVVAAAAITTALQTIVSRNCDPLDAAVVSVTVLEAGNTFNVIPQTARIRGTARSLSADVRDRLETRIGEIAAGIATAHGCVATTRYHRGYPVTVNDPDATAIFEGVARSEIGDDQWFPVERPVMGGEDFAYYGEQVPACFFVLGQQRDGGERMPTLHSPKYDFNDGTLETGIRLMSRLALDG